MSILVDQTSKVIVQGITGQNGAFHTRQMMGYGTNIVAGITPGKGGRQFDQHVPIFDSVADAVAETEADTSIIFVPAPFAADAMCEAAAAGIQLVVCITEGVPVLDMVKTLPYLEECGTRLIGPNCPGLISPGKAKLGIMPGHIHKPGRVGVISRSGTLTYEAVDQLTRLDHGQSTCVGIGGDSLIGSPFIDLLTLFENDEDTDAIVMIGEIGGNAEEAAAAFIAEQVSKPVVSFIAGQSAPKGKRMGHAGAIISGGRGTAASKMAALTYAGVHIVERPTEIGKKVVEVLG